LVAAQAVNFFWSMMPALSAQYITASQHIMPLRLAYSDDVTLLILRAKFAAWPSSGFMLPSLQESDDGSGKYDPGKPAAWGAWENCTPLLQSSSIFEGEPASIVISSATRRAV
jgi:hypothetical protein